MVTGEHVFEPPAKDYESIFCPCKFLFCLLEVTIAN